MSKKKNESVPEFGARERWLHSAADQIRAHFRDVFEKHFGDAGQSHLDKIRVSTGFPSRSGENGKVIGQCWKAEASTDSSHHIFISPLLTENVKVVATLAHEMVHAADNGENKHKGAFTRAVRDMGLEGKPTATFAGEEFASWVTELVDEIGDYPHAGLVPTVVEKPQKTYMLKAECPECGCIVRMTQKWLDEAGAPFCGKCTEYLEVGDDEFEFPVRMKVAVA